MQEVGIDKKASVILDFDEELIAICKPFPGEQTVSVTRLNRCTKYVHAIGFFKKLGLDPTFVHGVYPVFKGDESDLLVVDVQQWYTRRKKVAP